MNAVASALAALKSGQGLKGQLMRGGVGSIAVKIASTALNLVLAIVLARLLGAEGFGVYSFIFAIITILAIPAQMGLPNLVVRETAKAHANENWGLIKGLWRWSTQMALAMSAALIAIGALAAWIFADHFTPLQLQTFWWALPLIPLIALGNLRGAALRGLRHVVLGQLPEFIIRPVFFVSLVLGLAWAGGASRVDPSKAMMLHFAASAVAFVVGLLLLSRNSPASVSGAAYAQIDARPWLAAALPLAMMEGMLTLNDNIGLLVFGAVASTADVALLKIALQLSAFVTFGFLAVNAAVTPYIARLYAEENREKFELLAVRAAQLSIAVAVPIAAIFLFGGRQVIHILFGAEFESASFALAILTTAQIVNAFTGCAGALLYMTGHEAVVAKVVAYSCVLNLVLTLGFGTVWGINGAAVAGALALFFWNFALFVQVRKILGINCTALILP